MKGVEMDMILSQYDLEMVEKLRKFNILADVKGHLLDLSKPTGVVFCSDGDQAYDIFIQKVKSHGQCAYPRPHLFTGHGGALKLAPNSPINKPGRSARRDLLDEIAEARVLKAIDAIAIYVHTPCGKARKHKLSFLETVDLMMLAKTSIKKENPSLHVACFCHIDYGSKKRTYFISRDHWFQWRNSLVLL